jgi:hypothetical protein
LESEPNLLNKKFDYVRKVYTQGPRRNANQPTSGHLKTIRHPNAAKEMPIYPMQFEQCKRILRPNAAKESNLPDAIRTMKGGFAVPMPLKEFRLENTRNAIVAPPENAAKRVRRKYAPSLFERRKMAGWYSEIAQNARSLGKMLEKWSCGHAVYGNWMEERIGGWPAVGGEKERKDSVVSAASVLGLVIVIGTALQGCVVSASP